MKKKQQKLAYQPEYDFTLIGIASHESDYRLSWALNKKFSLSFIRVESLFINDPKNNAMQSFAVYNFEDKTAGLAFNLISNRCDNGFLIEEIKNIDFFLQIYGDLKTSLINKFLTDLRKIDVIITAVLFDPQSLQSKQKLIF